MSSKYLPKYIHNLLLFSDYHKLKPGFLKDIYINNAKKKRLNFCESLKNTLNKTCD